MDRHQPVVGALGKAEHLFVFSSSRPISIYPTLLVGD
jgi:hypothetical protein